ncbi:hypothetical protein, partial [Bacillus sp. CHD6a]|uniref:hypothetical protein n=1 Tax=Bacillus sp. CHD6a TaxID=1643452 RepID=UPI001E2FB2EC
FAEINSGVLKNYKIIDFFSGLLRCGVSPVSSSCRGLRAFHYNQQGGYINLKIYKTVFTRIN